MTATAIRPDAIDRRPAAAWHVVCDVCAQAGGDRWLADEALTIASADGVFVIFACRDCAEQPASDLLSRAGVLADLPPLYDCAGKPGDCHYCDAGDREERTPDGPQD